MVSTQLSFTEENYLKAIYSLSERSELFETSTNKIAERINIKPPTVTDMLRKLAEKKLVTYEKYKKIQLTKIGKQVAILIIRKHRLWEVFLVEKLGLRWDEVHEIAEQLEHIQSEKLINRLDFYLGHPKADPHGDPIPNGNGIFTKSKSILLSELKKGNMGKFTGVTDHSPSFLTYLDRLGLTLGDTIKIKAIEDYDHSFTLIMKGKKEILVSNKVANSLLISE